MLAIGLEPRRADGQTGNHRPEDEPRHRRRRPLRPGRRLALLAGSRLQWQARADRLRRAEEGEEDGVSKTKFTCPGCGQNAWAKPDAALMCAPCQEIMLPEGGSAGAEGDEEN